MLEARSSKTVAEALPDNPPVQVYRIRRRADSVGGAPVTPEDDAVRGQGRADQERRGDRGQSARLGRAKMALWSLNMRFLR